MTCFKDKGYFITGTDAIAISSENLLVCLVKIHYCNRSDDTQPISIHYLMHLKIRVLRLEELIEGYGEMGMIYHYKINTFVPEI